MKTKKGLKRIVSIVLCAVLLATSIPIAFAANGTYNPAPYFSEDAQSKGAAAWVDQQGDLQVRFPAATGRPTHAVWSVNPNETSNVKAISSYIIELSDLGGKLEAHNTNPPVLLSKTVTATATTGKLSAVFTAAELETLGDSFDFDNNRYNIAVTAVDEAGWHSLQLHALVFDIPEFTYNSTAVFEPFTENGYAMRELMRFEQAGSYTGYVQSGDSADRMGRAIHDGAPDPVTGVDSYAYRIRVVNHPGAAGQSIDTGESRQTWNFEGAEEVWYWLDLSDVELRGISFRLRANEKKLRWVSRTWNLDTSKAEQWTENGPANYYGDTVYSTLGTQYNTYAAGSEPYIWVQDEIGNWNKVIMNNGTVDLGHFKGYVRIPIQYICAETDSLVDSNSKEFGSKQGNNKNTLNNYFDTKIKLPNKVVVNTAGTPVADSLLIQEGQLWAGRLNGDLKYNMGKMLAAGIELGADNATTGEVAVNPNNPRRAYVEQDGSGNWVVQNRENGYKAIEDIYSAGIAYQGVSEDSLEESFFMDNIMFYRTDDKTWPENKGLGTGLVIGTSVNTYFDQGAEVQDKILDAIDEYIGTPSWTDYRGVKYVKDMIAKFTELYTNAKGEEYANRYFATEKLAARAAATGRTSTWNNYQTAISLCEGEGLMNGNNSRPNDLVPLMVQTLEKLPDPTTVTSISDTLYNEIVKLYKAYVRLNYGQLKMLGNYVRTDSEGNTVYYYEEEKILKYAELLANRLEEDTATGYKMANYPFIPFNDFEKNTSVGDSAWHIEDDPNFPSSSDYRQTKNFSTLATNDKKVVDGNGQTISQSYSEAHDYAHTGETRITKEGYINTKGLTTTFESAALQGDADGGVFYAIYFNKDSKTDASDVAAYRANNMSAANLAQLAKNNNSGLIEEVRNPDGSIYLPFSLIMYVDFSELDGDAGDFTFGVKIHTLNSSGTETCYRPAMGSTIGGNKYWRSYFILDQDPNSANFGEWKRVFVKDRGVTKGNYLFPSKTTNPQDGEEPASLAGYKGYIAIPMNHFKNGNLDGNMLVDNPTDMNNIYSITFGITNANGSAMNGKSITIDNVGFTYDPDYYKDQLGVDLSGRNDKSYDEAFGAKSSKASEFETAVADIDPYDTATLAEKIEIAKSIYGAPYNDDSTTLSQWQKDNVQTVKQAKALLDKYIAGDIPPAAMTVAELKTAIANLPNVPEKAVENNPLPNPGFLSDNTKPLEAGTVNYAAFGFESREQAEAIEKYYTETYKRLSAADKASLKDAEKTKFLNAYNAAMRCTDTLEIIKEKATVFSTDLAGIYDTYTDGTKTLRLIKVSERNRIADLSAREYDPLPYYAKTGLSDGSLIPAFENATDGISRFFANVITDESGNITDGGVKVLMEQYTQLYNDLNAELQAENKLSDDLIARLNETIAEYNDLIPSYKSIYELYFGTDDGTYKGIKDILDLFMRKDVSFSKEGTAEVTQATLDLNADNISTESQSLYVKYLEEYPVETGGASSTYFTIKYDGKLAAGTVLRDYELYLNDVIKVNPVKYDEEGIRITELDEALKNNTFTPAEPLEMKFTAKLTSTETFNQQLSDKVTIKHYRPADPEKNETAPVLLGTYILNITYTPDEAYTVTIPAEFPVDWGTADTDVSYTVDCVLKDTSKITVNVTGSGKLTAVKDSSLKMDYTTVGFTATEFRGVRTNAKPTTLPTVQISDAMWNTKPVGEYRDTLTYTVEYTTNS